MTQNSKMQQTIRTGPRPLTLHLTLSMLNSASCQNAWDLSKTDSWNWSPSLRKKATALQKKIDEFNYDLFKETIESTAKNQTKNFLKGIQLYRTHPYNRGMREKPVVWQNESTKLLNYSQQNTKHKTAILAIPSLINKSYILDLKTDQSFLQYIAELKAPTFLLDWGEPAKTELQYNLSNYMEEKLLPALDYLTKNISKQIILIGYCMGGNIALALSALRPQQIKANILLATPWDFQTGRENNWLARKIENNRSILELTINTHKHLPVDWLQAMFTSLTPFGVINKFQKFATMNMDGNTAENFVAL